MLVQVRDLLGNFERYRAFPLYGAHSAGAATPLRLAGTLERQRARTHTESRSATAVPKWLLYEATWTRVCRVTSHLLSRKDNAMKTVTMTEQQIAEFAQQAAQRAVAEYIAKNPPKTVLKPSDFKVVAVTNIPSKSGRTWGTLEIIDQRTGERTECFLDRVHDAGKRKDGADQQIFYATVRKPKADDAPAAPATQAKAKRKTSAVSAAVAASA